MIAVGDDGEADGRFTDDEIGRRQDCVTGLLETEAYEALRETLRGVGDIERILTRVALGSARPRDLTTLRQALECLPRIHDRLDELDFGRLGELRAALAGHEAVLAQLREAVVESPPTLVRDGGVIAPGYDAELDELRELSANADAYLLKLESRERERSGIASLKVGYNRVHGYYIEVGRSHSEKVPVDYVRPSATSRPNSRRSRTRC